MDLRWLAGLMFTAFAFALLSLHSAWAVLPAATGVYILGSKLRDELGL
jgi:hypothetical protein